MWGGPDDGLFWDVDDGMREINVPVLPQETRARIAHPSRGPQEIEFEVRTLPIFIRNGKAYVDGR